MNFKIDPGVKKIVSSIALLVDSQEQRFENSAALANFEFDTRYSVEYITAKDNAI